MQRYMRKFLGCDKGATAIEYGLIASLIIVVIIAAIQGLGQTVLDTLYNKLSTMF